MSTKTIDILHAAAQEIVKERGITLVDAYAEMRRVPQLWSKATGIREDLVKAICAAEILFYSPTEAA